MQKLSVPVVVLLLAVAFSSPARAGGAQLDFDQEFYVPGDVVSAHSSVWLRSAQGRLEDGPYFAYLHEAAADYPPPLPETALRVAPVHVVERPTGEHGDASTEFVMPDVAPGRYALTLCNDPCAKLLGDIMPTDFIVAADDAEGRLALVRDRLSDRIRRFRILLGSRVLGARAESLRGRVISLERDVTRLMADVDELKSAARTAPRDRARSDGDAVPEALAFVVPAAALGLVVGRRLRRAR